MGQSLDLKNIFSSYVNSVLLKEQVEGGIEKSEAEKDPKWMQAKAAWEKLTGKKFDEMPTAQKNSISRNVLKPAAQKGYLENPRTKERTPISGEQTQQSTQVAQPVAQQTSNSEIEKLKKELEQLKALMQKSTKQEEEENEDEGWQQIGEPETSNVNHEYERINSGNTTTIRPKNRAGLNQEEEENEDEGWQQIGEPETSNVNHEYKTKTSGNTTTITRENKNISKFLKALSEKNYSYANKYLNNIVQSKVKRKISGEIK